LFNLHSPVNQTEAGLVLISNRVWHANSLGVSHSNSDIDLSISYRADSITMPSLLTIPREIRDEIYGWALLETLASSRSKDLQRERKTITYSPSDPETFYGEEAVRYPVHTSLPPTNALLHTTRQIRHEFLDSIKRLGSLRYKVDLTDRKDKGVLAPTWISVPCFADRIDVLEVQWRCRFGKTSSIATYVGDDQNGWSGQSFSASLALLQRFVERGIYLLSKKKARKIHIGLLEIQINLGADSTQQWASEFVEETGRFLDCWMIGDEAGAYDPDSRAREEAQWRLLAGKIDRVELHANGALQREWVISEMVVKRDEAERVRNAETEE
jgi:hypothetical protein